MHLVPKRQLFARPSVMREVVEANTITRKAKLILHNFWCVANGSKQEYSGERNCLYNTV